MHTFNKNLNYYFEYLSPHEQLKEINEMTYKQQLLTKMTAKQDTNRNHNYLDLLTDDYYYEPRLVTNTKHDKYYVCKVNNDLSVRQYFLLVVPHTPELINEHKNESNEWIIQLIMQICFINPNEKPTRVKMFNYDKNKAYW